MSESSHVLSDGAKFLTGENRGNREVAGTAAVLSVASFSSCPKPAPRSLAARPGWGSVSAYRWMAVDSIAADSRLPIAQERTVTAHAGRRWPRHTQVPYN